MNFLRKLFTNETDRRVAEIQAYNEERAKEASKAALDLKKLLMKNGVTLQIYIATGGDKRHG
jgi:hypothetical protein